MFTVGLCITWGQNKWRDIPPTSTEWDIYRIMLNKAGRADQRIKEMDNITVEQREWLSQNEWEILKDEINL